jgi:hypothetical protein
MLLGTYDVALACYETAYDQKPEPKLLYNRSRALEHLRRNAEALTLLQQFERDAPSELREKVPGLAELIATLTAQVGTISVRANVPAGIWVDGVHVGDTPMEHALFADPGRTEVELRATGYHPFAVTLNIGAGQSEMVNATLEPRATAVPSPTPPVPSPGEDQVAESRPSSYAPPEDSNVVAYSALGVGGVGLLAALIGYVTATGFHDDVCGGALRCASDEYDPDALENYNLARNVYTAGLIVGGAGLAVGTGLLLFDSTSDESSESGSGFNATLELTGVKLRGQF